MAEAGKTFHLDIITPDASVLSDDVEFVVARALDGDLGIMPNHAPLIASLDIGPLSYIKDGVRQYISVAEGFMEVSHNTVTIITPAAEHPTDIDVERAQRARERAEKRLQSKSQEIDTALAEAALKRALLRIDVAEQYSGKQ